MKSFATEIPIRATPEAIWSILADAAAYPAWNSTVERVEGRIARGETIKVHARISPGRAFPVRVTELDPPRRMVWTGGMPLGLFTGTRTFTLAPRSDGMVAFAMGETFTGLLAPLIARSIPDLQPAFDAFAADLKRRAESGG
ncbi:MAG: SRPBCC domain-containing protein [Alphaproteobacteria bacterium]|nr:SRPBCC domain-containing protein [Alphaproteobacteria bacterium]